MPHTLTAQITYLIYGAICIFALWKGDRWERFASVVLLITTIATPLLQDRAHFMDPEARLLAEDIILLAIFIGLAIRFGKPWMIFAAAFQLLSTLSHPAAHFAHEIGPLAYLTICQLFSYGVFLSLGASVLIRLVQRHREL